MLVAELDGLFGRVCADASAPHVSVPEPMAGDETWMGEVAAVDGAHPSAGGYVALAELVRPSWRQWAADPYR